jgi:predicted TIM-barrel enzyme
VRLLELDRHINDLEFAAAIADEFLKSAETSDGLHVGASSVERLPTEKAITAQTREFKAAAREAL